MPRSLQPPTLEAVQDLPSLQQIASPIERAMELMGDKYSLVIIQTLQQFGRQRFVELSDQITGISPRTLSARLKHLEHHGLLHRQQFPTIPPRVEYSLTEAGHDLAETLDHLVRWTNRWYPYAPQKA